MRTSHSSASPSTRSRRTWHARVRRCSEARRGGAGCPELGRGREAASAGDVGELEGLLVYTERAHFFRRHLLKGDAQLAFYGLPSYAHFYPELAQMLCAAPSDQPRGGGAAAGGTCVALFSKYDLQPLRRLVGDARATRMVAGRETSFLFQ